MSDEEEREEFERKHRKAKELYESLQEEKASPSESPPPSREAFVSKNQMTDEQLKELVEKVDRDQKDHSIPLSPEEKRVYTDKNGNSIGVTTSRYTETPAYEGGDTGRQRAKFTGHEIAEPPAKEKQEHQTEHQSEGTYTKYQSPAREPKNYNPSPGGTSTTYEAPPKKSAHQYVHGKDTSQASQMAHDSTFWQKEQTEPTPSLTRLSQTRKAHIDPRTEGTPIDTPFFKPHSPESITTRILEAPRRIKEKAEQIGYRAEQKYEQVRGKPVSIAAQKLYDARAAENDLKFHRGEISETIHRARNAQYEKARATSSIPIEKRLVGDINNLGQGGMIRNVTDTFVRGAVGERTPAERRAGMHPISVMEKIESTYRPSPQPRFRAGKGTKQTSPTKGTVVSNVKKGIDFGKTSFLGAGLSTQSPAFSMNTQLFSQPPSPREEEELRKRKKPRRGR